MVNANDVARYFLCLVDEDSGDLMSNLKLQKLLYYAQGFHLATFGKPLFADKIKAWMHGPVVPDVYHEYKQYGAGAIPRPDDFDPGQFGSELRELLDEVFEVYGQYSATALRNFTHEEPPWRNTETDQEISHDLMRRYFESRLR
jgi:uncharacterized phage-associated protein